MTISREGLKRLPGTRTTGSLRKLPGIRGYNARHAFRQMKATIIKSGLVEEDPGGRYSKRCHEELMEQAERAASGWRTCCTNSCPGNTDKPFSQNIRKLASSGRPVKNKSGANKTILVIIVTLSLILAIRVFIYSGPAAEEGRMREAPGRTAGGGGQEPRQSIEGIREI